MVWILDLYIIMAANIRFDSVNPFNEYPIWSMNDYTQILANWRSYHRQYRAPQLQYYTYRSFPAVAQFTLHMPGSNFQNLINHSSYFAGLQRLQQTQIQPQMSFTIKSDPFVPLPIGLSAHLISLNSRPVPTLPDFRIVNIHDFVNICIFYNFDLMLDQMLNFSLDTGLHYFPQFFRHLYKNMPRNDPLVLSLVQGFLITWNEAQQERLEDYFPVQPAIGPLSLAQWAEILYQHFPILPGLARSLIQSPTKRLRRWDHTGRQVAPVFPVCPACERHISNPHQRDFTLTTCCHEVIHTDCLSRFQFCYICHHNNHKFPQFYQEIAFTTPDILKERKYLYWNPCNEPYCNIPNCWVYERPDRHWHVFPHITHEELAKTYFLSHQEYLEWLLDNLYRPNQHSCHFYRCF